MTQQDLLERPAAEAASATADDPREQALIDAACEQACQAIAPAWPLDRAIAVNPHWGRVGLPLRRVAARLALFGGVHVYPSRAYLRDAFARGRIRLADLQEAVARLSQTGETGWMEAADATLLEQEPHLPPLPLLIDLLDDGPGRAHRLPWRQAVTHQVSQTCAAYFDQHQADWHPQRTQGLYAFWRDTLQHDHGIGVLMGLPHLGRRLASLPATPAEAERWVLRKLGLPPEVWADYLEALLLTINGWASWCAYLQWQARQAGGSDSHLRELLAIRLAWGAILLDGEPTPERSTAFTTLQQAWSGAGARYRQAEQVLQVEELWQLALEVGYQRRLAQQMARPVTVTPPDTVEVQAAFCIDVRSEPLRRAIETAWPAVQTLGFAGFFGLPVAYTPLGTDARRPQLPGLLAPALDVQDQVIPAQASCTTALTTEQAGQLRQRRLVLAGQWQAASRWPAAAFSFVESFGWAYGGKLGQWLRARPRARRRDELAGLPGAVRAACRPTLDHLDLASRADLCARILRLMGLDRHLAPLVLLVGHGSQSANNPQAAALDCGACCGQTGEVNARVLARLLNDADVRTALVQRGITIPPATVFVAALHNTTTDEVEWFDRDLLPPAAQPRLERFEQSLGVALDQVRRERAARLGLEAPSRPSALLSVLQRRANDGAQTRPEWGLAGNAAFIIGPRHLTRGLALDGRSFLHDYDAARDSDGAVLELLMTAPMLVTHWINWQYHASSCEPASYGSGNKVLHNVVGGRIGVFEGNGGDLRIGLSRQSLHDGQRWIHEPLRLTVVIAAPQERIAAIIERHAIVRQLVENGWLHLWHCAPNGTLSRHAGGVWLTVDAPAD